MGSAHGMAEHRERYHDFMDFLARHGYTVIIHDHLFCGHGASVASKDDYFGYFGPLGQPKPSHVYSDVSNPTSSDPAAGIISDVHQITDYIKTTLPGSSAHFRTQYLALVVRCYSSNTTKISDRPLSVAHLLQKYRCRSRHYHC